MKLGSIIKTRFDDSQASVKNTKAELTTSNCTQIATSIKNKSMIKMKMLSITASISVLLLSSQLVHADGIYLSDMQTNLTPASLALSTHQ